jgi:peptidoglycan/LPS O-acetylase OafA/YrhL
MKRSAALDFLRGSAAFAVAIPHWLMADAPFQPKTEAVAIAGVEVFFVLSGFVLAPQILDFVVGKPWRNLGVFLARRWMRTIPPYVVALVAVALMTGKLFTADLLRYLFYVQNLFYAANKSDFYPVAWSLSVEEWFAAHVSGGAHSQAFRPADGSRLRSARHRRGRSGAVPSRPA